MRKVQNIMPLVMGFLFKDVPSVSSLRLMQNVLTWVSQMLPEPVHRPRPGLDEAEGVLTPRGAETGPWRASWPIRTEEAMSSSPPRHHRRLGARGRQADGLPPA